ncbi:MAG: hypothetical protein Ta2G_13510 [Termitinemataceae bacterium]|nr:MAG: hypothetical protein Ta2G_13510 [Termitinemataceae bacterium]
MAQEDEEDEREEKYDDAAALTSFEDTDGGAGFFNRKKVLISIGIAFAVIICGAALFNTNKNKNKDDETQGRAARAPSEFLKNELSRSANRANRSDDLIPVSYTENGVIVEEDGKEISGLPKVTAYNDNDNKTFRDAAPSQGEAGSGASGGSGDRGGRMQEITANRSRLTPSLEGSLFGGANTAQNSTAPPSNPYAAQYPYMSTAQQQSLDRLNASPTITNIPPGTQGDYLLQNNQADKKGFYNSSSTGSAISNGYFLGNNALWPGVIIPAVLQTAINTDLPGNIIARVSENIYDSYEGNKLLIPQGTVLVAKYNSSVSYAQHRVQIVWDLLIRPDGFYLELEGMNGVDKKGMSGQEAKYSENWFEYLKAAGIITMFSVANSKMAEEAAKYADNNTSSAMVAGNAEFLNNVGSNIVGKAMNIQPTLTVNNGEVLNIMLNKTVYLPPVQDYPVSEKYLR